MDKEFFMYNEKTNKELVKFKKEKFIEADLSYLDYLKEK